MTRPTTITDAEAKLPSYGTADGDGQQLRLFLAAEAVRIAMRGRLPFVEAARLSGETEAEFDRLMTGGDEGDLWRLFALLRSLGAVAIVGVERNPVPAAKGGVLWSRLDLSPAALPDRPVSS